jgi:hypothetical protein
MIQTKIEVLKEIYKFLVNYLHYILGPKNSFLSFNI